MRPCSTAQCPKKHYAKGLCKKHYQIAWLAGPAHKACLVVGCGRRYHCRGLCQKHYGGLSDVKNRDVARKCDRLKTDAAFRAKQNTKKHTRHTTRRHTDPTFKLKDNARIHAHRNKRRYIDPLFKFKDGIRTTIFMSFGRRGFAKTSKTAQILGCDFETAFKYIGWFPGCQIHHIVFMETAKTIEDVIRLNYYTNLIAMTKEAHKELHRIQGTDGELDINIPPVVQWEYGPTIH